MNDSTAHAEVMTIQSACASLGVFNLGCIKKEESELPQMDGRSHCVIYSSAESCPVCYSAICWVNMPMLLFATMRFDAAAKGTNFSEEAIMKNCLSDTPGAISRFINAQLTLPLIRSFFGKTSRKYRTNVTLRTGGEA